MGVYIKGMVMPDISDYNGINCCLYKTLGGQLRLRNNETGQSFEAVPVPPHGDLISRETAKLYHSYLVDERTDIRVPAIPLSVLNVIPTIIQAEPAEEGEK